jgi:molybdate transport system permease protein
MRTTGAATIITLALALVAAHWRTRRPRRGGTLLDTALVLPLVLPPTVTGLILLHVFGRNSPIGASLADLGVRVVFSWAATVIAAVTVALPLAYYAIVAAFRLVDRDLIDAARIYGCGEWSLLWRVMVPLAWPGVAAATLLAFARSLGEFGATLMLAGNIPGRTQTMPVAVFFASEAGDSARALALALGLLGISLCVTLLLNVFARHRVPS